MTVKEVRDRVAEVAGTGYDNEHAHGVEDDLYKAVLAAIADGAPNARELATEALKASAVDFIRWYA